MAANPYSNKISVLKLTNEAYVKSKLAFLKKFVASGSVDVFQDEAGDVQKQAKVIFDWIGEVLWSGTAGIDMKVFELMCKAYSALYMSKCNDEAAMDPRRRYHGGIRHAR